jgi:hypothetical protein
MEKQKFVQLNFNRFYKKLNVEGIVDCYVLTSSQF